MKWIGLTGGIATGKSTVSQVLRDLDYEVVDADLLARKAVEPGSQGLHEVVRIFGPSVLRADGLLNRSQLGRLIFSDEKKRDQLEMIIHPKVRQLAQQERSRLELEGHELAFYDVPLLFEKKMENIFDGIVLVYCPVDIQLERLIKREGCTEKEAYQRLASQLPIEQKLTKAQWVISNIGSLAQLRQEVYQCLEKLRKVL